MACRAAFLLCALSLLPLEPAEAQSRAAGYGRLPMRFEANQGQTDPRVRFVARGAGYAFFITDTETVAVLQKDGAAPAVIRMQLIGGSDYPHIEGGKRFEGKSNYLVGSDPATWRVNVPQFGNVRMSQVYRGIDVVYYGNQGEIEYDFLVAPRSDPRQIGMRFEGAEAIDIDAAGDLVLHIAGGAIRQRAPIAYQVRNGARHAVDARYRRRGAREFGITLGKYDRALPLVIDPALAWSTYLGGSGADVASGITVDAAGNAYVTGTTASIDFPTANALQAAMNAGGPDAFVTKLNAAGTALVYSTYLGGSGGDYGQEVVVDGSGNAYVAGYTASSNFPTVNAIQAANGGGLDAFVAKLNAAGTALLYSSYLGGSASEQAFAIDIDSSGNAYVAGATESGNFPTANAIQAASAGGGSDGFVTKLNAAGSALVYSTYLGGSTFDAVSDLAVDGTGSAYVTGVTTSTDFPAVNALQAANAGSVDGFVTKFNAAGSAIVYSTYLGGANLDEAYAIAVDDAGNAYVAGSTSSTDFPTANALQAASAGPSDAFVTKLNAAGSALVYSTYLGGFGRDAARTIAVDGFGNAYLAGRTASIDFPTVNALQPVPGGAYDAFVTTLNAAGSALVDSTYLGGTSDEEGSSIAVDGTGVYVAGFTASSDFPTANALQASHNGGNDGFVAKLLVPSADLEIEKAVTGAFVAGQDGTFTITVTNHGPTQATGVTVTDSIPAGATFVSATPSQGSCNAASPVACTLGTIDNGASATIALVVRPASDGPLSNTVDVTATTPDPNAANDSSTAIAQVAGSANLSIVKTAAGPFFAGTSATFTITVTNGGPTAADGVTVTDILPAGVNFISATPSQGTCNAASPVVCTLGTIGNGGMATIALVVQPTAAGPLSNTATVSSSTADVDPANNGSTALVEVQPASAFPAIPALDGRTLMLLAALLAGLGMRRSWLP